MAPVLDEFRSNSSPVGTILKFVLICVTAARLSAQQYVISTVAGGAASDAGARDQRQRFSPHSSHVGSQRQHLFRQQSLRFSPRPFGSSHPPRGYRASRVLGRWRTCSPCPTQFTQRCCRGENYRVRRVSPSGIITTVAGTGGFGFYSPPKDGVSAAGVAIGTPQAVAVAVDGAGNLFFSDRYYTSGSDGRIRKVTPDGLLSTVAGGGTDTPGDGEPAIGVHLTGARTLVVDHAGNLYFDESYRIFKVDTTGAVTALAGTGTAGFSGDDGPAVQAQITIPSGQASAVNQDGTLNDAIHPAGAGTLLSLYVTGAGQMSPPTTDGKIIDASAPLPQPRLPVGVTVDGFAAQIIYAGAAPGEVAGLMQILLRIPSGAHSGGYVPVSIQVGGASTIPDAAWIAVAASATQAPN